MQAADFLNTPEEALQIYRFLNSPGAGMRDVALQWLVLFDQPTPNDAGRARMAERETRNLSQVAHIREAMADVPGGRVLVIGSSAHKPWFDAYRDVMIDVEVVDALKVLEQACRLRHSRTGAGDAGGSLS